MTDPEDFEGTDADFKELARQVQADALDHKPGTPTKESLAEGVE